jgi:hypothetical protein
VGRDARNALAGIRESFRKRSMTLITRAKDKRIIIVTAPATLGKRVSLPCQLVRRYEQSTENCK